MKSYHINKGAGLAGLTIREHDIPAPGPREVLVRVRASSLSFRELLILILGYYPLPIRPDVVPVAEGAGEIVAIGSNVTRVQVGERVAGAAFPYWMDGPFAWDSAAQLGGSLDGMLTEYAVLPEEGVAHIPEHLSFERCPSSASPPGMRSQVVDPCRPVTRCSPWDQEAFRSALFSSPNSLVRVSLRPRRARRRQSGSRLWGPTTWSTTARRPIGMWRCAN